MPQSEETRANAVDQQTVTAQGPVTASAPSSAPNSASNSVGAAQGRSTVTASGGINGGTDGRAADAAESPAVDGTPTKWIFGFGSLIHNPGFAYSRRVTGYIKGYKRVFYQGSTDHRGTPGAPGRVVTLIHDPDSITWGGAFALAGTPAEQAEILKYLEWREKQYDVREIVDVFGAQDDQHPIVPGALVYIASEDRTRNSNYLGPATVEELAAQIASAHGPSGPNAEYLYRLAEAMAEIGVHDAELVELEAAVRALQAVAASAALSAHACGQDGQA